MDLRPQINHEAKAIATEAYFAAEHLESAKPVAFMMFALGVGCVVGSSLLEIPLAKLLLSVTISVSLGALFLVVRWFLRFGAYELTDDDFLTARRKAKSSLWLWLAVLFAELIGFITLGW